jgi:photosystem II stability/assembly factor-like uncharacterized protein
MRRVAPFLILAILFLFSCNSQDTSPTEEQPANTSATQVPAQTDDSGIATADHTATFTAEPSEIPTSSSEPRRDLTIPHLTSPQLVTISSIHMLDVATGWAIGWAEPGEDHILFTDDGGNSWTDRTPPESAAPSIGDQKGASAFFFDENLAWVRYLDSTIVWRTKDSGLSWEAGDELDVDIRIPVDIAPPSIQFVNPETGWVMIYLESGMSHDWIVLYQTKNGGLTWELLLHPSEDSDLMGCCKTGILFHDANTGIVTFGIGPYTAPHFSLSIDGGKTWSFTPLDVSQIGSPAAEFTNCEAHSPHIFTSGLIRLGMICTTYSEPEEVRNFVYSSGNEGETWNFETYPGGTLQFLNQQIGWALDREIYRTIDGGVTWSLMTNVNWDAQFSFISENQGWAVARSGDEIGLVMTEDGGKTWELLEPEVGT